jgi:FixJ family two-component response regulator
MGTPSAAEFNVVSEVMVSARIAVVEDHEGMRRAFVRLLEASGYAVSSFESAEAFLSWEERQRAECLVLDVRLPGLSGFELRECLVGEGWHRPVLYVTAHDDPAARERAAREGAAFLLKPVHGRTLLAAIADALQPS